MARRKRPQDVLLPALTAILSLAAVAVIVLVVLRVTAPADADLTTHALGTTPTPGSTNPITNNSTGGAPRSLFTDVTTEVGLDFEHVRAGPQRWRPDILGSGGTFIDYDNDGDLDVYLPQGGRADSTDPPRNRLYRNDGANGFTDVSRHAGADVPGPCFAAAAGDYDNDGHTDLYITRLGADVLLRNRGDGAFEDVTATAGLGGDAFSTAAVWLDFDRDGRLDLFVATDVNWTPGAETGCYDASGRHDYCDATIFQSSANLLYHNTGDGRFKDVSKPSKIGSRRSNALGVTCTDIDGDGWIDIYVACDKTPTQVWINRTNGTFDDISAQTTCAYLKDGRIPVGRGATAEDLDGDGDWDVIVAADRYMAFQQLDNDRRTLSDRAAASGLAALTLPYSGFGIAALDVDHDGGLELALAHGAVARSNVLSAPNTPPADPYAQGNQLLTWNENDHLVDITDQTGATFSAPHSSRAMVAGDIDNDGDVDLLVTNNGGRAQLLRNVSATDRAWAMFDLRTGTPDRTAIGARVELFVGIKSHRREVRPQSGYLSSHDPRLHFGLGNATSIERLTVQWPDGAVERWGQLPVRRRLVLRQGQSPDVETQP